MTVKELKQNLSCFEDDAEVFFAYPSGDYWGHTLAKEVDDVDAQPIAWSEYHRTYKLMDEDCDGEYDDVKRKEVIVLF